MRKEHQKTTAKKKPSARRSTPKRKTVKTPHHSGKGRGERSRLDWGRLWPLLLGAVIVGVTCWLLLRAILSSEVDTAPAPPPGYTVHGIDVSHHQGTIDWELLRNQAVIDGQPLSFAFIKATEGSDMVDSHFSRNIAAARQYGIMCGAYHFFRASVSAKQQAEHFIRNVQLSSGDLPPVLDVEVKPDDVSQEDFRQGILEWLVRVEQHYGVKPILYTYHSFRQQYMNDSVFNIYPYWIAHYYVDTLRYRGEWAFWQHSDKGSLPGIKGAVDFDVFNGSYDELSKMSVK